MLLNRIVQLFWKLIVAALKLNPGYVIGAAISLTAAREKLYVYVTQLATS